MAPKRWARWTACFIARRKATRFSSWSAIAARDQQGVELGLADLLDGDADALAGHGFERAAQLLDLDAALADDDARLGRVDRDRDHVGRALDLDLRDARVRHAGHDVLADADVLEQQVGVLLARGEPAPVPVFDRAVADFDAEAEADRVNFLSHSCV